MTSQTTAHHEVQPDGTAQEIDPTDIGIAAATRVALKDMTPEQLEQAEWKFLYNTLVKAQIELQAGGVRMSWMDPAVQIAKERWRQPDRFKVAMPSGADTERLDWVLPILTGEDNPETDRRTVALGLALMLGQDGRTAIDTARASATA